MLKSIEDLMKFKGIGPKIANLFFQIAHKKNTGIAVDTHCHRIPNRLKWIKTSNPIKTKEALESIFPQSEWPYVNEVLVGFGQSICTAKVPKCRDCPINHMCIANENYTRKKLKKIRTDFENLQD